MEHANRDKGSKMQRKYKYGDRVHVWDIPGIGCEGEFEPGTVFTITEVNQNYYKINDPSGCYYDEENLTPEGVLPIKLLEAQQKVKTTKQSHTKTMWGLAVKSAPNTIDDELFTTRAKARRCKFANDLNYAKVVKVTLTWEG